MKTGLPENPVTTVRDLIDDLARFSAEDVHLIDPANDRSIRYGQSRDSIATIAGRIGSLGVEPGQSVAYAFSNSVDAALAILGIMYGDYVATAINLVSGEATIEYVLEHSEAKLIIVDSEAENLIRPIASRSKSPIDIISLETLLIAGAPASPLSKASPDHPALLMYTSGTTGKPKGVVHTHKSILCGGRNTADAHQLSEADSGFCVLPFYHINAFCVSLIGSLVSGGSLVVPTGFSVSSFWETIGKHDCTWFSVVPTQVSYLLHGAEKTGNEIYKNENLRFGRSASAPLSPEMHAAFEDTFDVPLIETMGLTETAAQILSNPLPPGERKIGSPGIAYGNEVIIADGSQNEVPRGTEGEILVRGPNVLSEYLKNPEATSEAITPDNWFRTGDLGRMDDDGYVYVTGRLKELIIKGGENIAPREVDEALYTHPAVIEAAAFGVKCRDYGERVEAGVKVTGDHSVTGDDLIEICRKKLGKFKSPDKVHILDELPKGPSGKIQRIKLAEQVTAAAAQHK